MCYIYSGDRIAKHPAIDARNKEQHVWNNWNILCKRRPHIYDYIQPEFAQKLINQHFSGEENRRLLIWSLINFEWWLRIFKENSRGEL
ncbi:MAG: hypothetical protein GY765_15145 [bacterium]|nr:hypothetical protein [bacterium]